MPQIPDDLEKMRENDKRKQLERAQHAEEMLTQRKLTQERLEAMAREMFPDAKPGEITMIVCNRGGNAAR